jgi:hypothetical protein
MAIFCAAGWTSGSPNWPDVASQSAQHGNGAGKRVSQSPVSTPWAPTHGGEKEEIGGHPQTLGRTLPCTLITHTSALSYHCEPFWQRREGAAISNPFLGRARSIAPLLTPSDSRKELPHLFSHSRGGGNPGVATGIAFQPSGPHSWGKMRRIGDTPNPGSILLRHHSVQPGHPFLGEKRSGAEGHHRTPGPPQADLRPTAPFQARAVLVRARKEIDSVVSKK